MEKRHEGNMGRRHCALGLALPLKLKALENIQLLSDGIRKVEEHFCALLIQHNVPWGTGQETVIWR